MLCRSPTINAALYTVLALLPAALASACSGASDGDPNGGSAGAAPAGAGGSPAAAAGAPVGGGLPLAGSAGSATGVGGEPSAGAPNAGGSTSGGTGGSGGDANAGGPSSGSSGESAGSAGAAGGGNTGPQSICAFSSGMNVAWVRFGSDIPNPDLNTFHTIFKYTRSAGGRMLRWWLHTNGTVSPGYDGSGLTQKLPQSHIDGIKSVLSAAHTDGVSVVISLWSFDMLQSNAGLAHTNNQKLLENDTNRQAYVDNYLTPLVNAIKGTPGLYAWEIFNEPEGMSPSGWATYRTTRAAIQKTVNWFADAIHNADPNALVTNGTQVMEANSTANGKQNYYSDSALRGVGGRQKGTLDFYEVHYYKSNGSGNSPFAHPASFWQMDKKLVIGEFGGPDGETIDGVSRTNLLTSLFDRGYNGGWPWSYSADANNGSQPSKGGEIDLPLITFNKAHPDAACP